MRCRLEWNLMSFGGQMNWIEDLVARAQMKSDLTAHLLPKISPVFEELKERLTADIESINRSIGHEVVCLQSGGPHAISLSCVTGEVMSIACFNDVSLQLEIEISAADEEISKHYLSVSTNLNGGPPVFTEFGEKASLERISQLMIQPMVEYSLQLHEFERPDEF